MSALDDMTMDELVRLENKYNEDRTGFILQVRTAIKHKQIAAFRAEAEA
jgi:hypothetical protein